MLDDVVRKAASALPAAQPLHHVGHERVGRGEDFERHGETEVTDVRRLNTVIDALDDAFGVVTFDVGGARTERGCPTVAADEVSDVRGILQAAYNAAIRIEMLVGLVF